VNSAFMIRFISVMVLSLSPGSLFAQSATPVNAAQTFHIHGVIHSTYNDSPVSGIKVQFVSENISTTVSTDRKGVYEADLPLGLYTMTVQFLYPYLQGYERPLFRVASPISLVLNVNLDSYVEMSCELGDPPPGSQISERDRAKSACGGQDSFPLPSEDGAPFQLLIRFGTRKPTDNGYTYSAPVDFSVVPEPSYVYRSGRNPPTLGTPVFVAYNLFTLRADHVTYDEMNRTLHANGKVVVINEKGESQRADSMSFRIENGEAIPLH